MHKTAEFDKMALLGVGRALFDEIWLKVAARLRFCGEKLSFILIYILFYKCVVQRA